MIYRELSAGEFADLSSRILYEDNHLLIVNKKVGEIVQGDKTGDEPLSDTYKAFIAMRDSKPGQVFLGLPHRLDRPVSGITVLAKTSKALERLNAMFRDSQVHNHARISSPLLFVSIKAQFWDRTESRLTVRTFQGSGSPFSQAVIVMARFPSI